MERINPGLEQLKLLILIGAFRFTGTSKKALLWEAHSLYKKVQLQLQNVQVMFAEPPIQFNLPILANDPLDDIYDQIELLGFPLCNPFGLADEDPDKYTAAKDLKNFSGKFVTVFIYFIVHKRVQTKNGEEMYFGTFIDAQGEFFDTVHFPPSLKYYPFRGDGMYLVLGKVVEEFGFPSIEVEKMAKMPFQINPKS
jgi:DNA polymerase-3 subunit alpha